MKWKTRSAYFFFLLLRPSLVYLKLDSWYSNGETENTLYSYIMNNMCGPQCVLYLLYVLSSLHTRKVHSRVYIVNYRGGYDLFIPISRPKTGECRYRYESWRKNKIEVCIWINFITWWNLEEVFLIVNCNSENDLPPAVHAFIPLHLPMKLQTQSQMMQQSKWNWTNALLFFFFFFAFFGVSLFCK